MNTDKNGGPAFPVPLNPGESYQSHALCDGMTLRDYFAAKAMQGLITSRHPGHHGQDGPAQLAYDAYLIADAMLAARGAQ